MTVQSNMKQPVFILGVTGYILLLAGVALLGEYRDFGRLFIFTSLVTMGIHWMLSIIHVIRNNSFGNEVSRYFWLALIIMVPPLAGMIYFMVDDRTFEW